MTACAPVPHQSGCPRSLFTCVSVLLAHAPQRLSELIGVTCKNPRQAQAREHCMHLGWQRLLFQLLTVSHPSQAQNARHGRRTFRSLATPFQMSLFAHSQPDRANPDFTRGLITTASTCKRNLAQLVLSNNEACLVAAKYCKEGSKTAVLLR